MVKKILYILIGPQGAGKSTYAEHQIKKDPSINRVSQDDLGRDGHFKYFMELINSGTQKIMIDRINHTKTQRERYTVPARSAGYEIHYIFIVTPKAVCIERMRKRKNHPTIKEGANYEQILGVFWNNFEYPMKDEYDNISMVKCVDRDVQICRV